MNLSYWEYNTFFKEIDTLIIGSGIVGLNAAITLKEQHPDKKIVIVERGALPSGASTKNAGFACFGSISELLDDLQHHDEDEVWALVEKRWKGLLRLQERLGEHQIELKKSGNYELFLKEDQQLYKQCMEIMPKFNTVLKDVIGHSEVFISKDHELKNFGFQGFNHLILNQAEGQINTGKMMEALLALAREKGIIIFNGVQINDFEEYPNHIQVSTAQGWKIEAKQVLLATNGFTKRFFPELEVSPARNQVVITSPIPDLPVDGCFHYDKGYVYFRNVGNRVLLGGGRNKARKEETTDHFGQTSLIQDYLDQLLKEKILPNKSFEIEHRWSGILGVADQKKPLIQWISNRIAIAVRMGGMGIAIGSLVGEQGAALINERI